MKTKLAMFIVCAIISCGVAVGRTSLAEEYITEAHNAYNEEQKLQTTCHWLLWSKCPHSLAANRNCAAG
jgi:hypothetical protein